MRTTRHASGSTAEPDVKRSGSVAAGSAERSSVLRAELRVRRRDGHACPLGGGRDRTVVAHDVVRPDGNDGNGLECRSTIESEAGTRIVGKPIEEGCVCPVFRSHDCVASIEAADRGEIVVSLSLPSREVLPEIVEDLRGVGATVELRSISKGGHPSEGRRLTIDADAVTEKQREAIAVAFEEGYYDTPRGADLGDLSDRLGVSRSAVSQRLTAAESTLIGALYDLEARIDE
ncbi:bacterio-opsin activator [Halorubrum sp. JWXQ-INN 858]|uniref:helix-turn-helix domain-containing protein n=1 Tax=Halorubrum sp. JWXQ-INN 858 TaxID=2690782 RepID=UPI00135918F0|nr:helix-turn-helix domain-containing protein [Halorubrum sp. JWXQ-INN 858]MWV64584.1 bacterio-opsin activator [Halorubrum sp. JWXQ-INN 858]